MFRIRIRPVPKLFGLKEPDPPLSLQTTIYLFKMYYKVSKFIMITNTILEKF